MSAAMHRGEPLATSRDKLIERLASGGRYDVAVVGGGATGLGVALDAAARGFRVLLLEAEDFAKGTSSRSTKLVHGGVRYLAQGNVGLVREALRERSTLLRNAPHLAQPLAFVIPSYRWWEKPYYGVGLKAYDLLAGAAGLGPTELLSAATTHERMVGLRSAGLRGGVQYWDGQFDDARLAVTLARTAAAHGALLLNYCAVTGLRYDGGGRISGLNAVDRETERSFAIDASCVVNATGVWVDRLREDDARAGGGASTPMLAPSQGLHLVVDAAFLPGERALMVPRTTDGRVLFGVPWMGHVILGTTDTPRDDLPLEPRPLRAEVDFILGEVSRFLSRAPSVQDVRSAWVGLRPLVREPSGDGASAPTKGISREHAVVVARSGLVTVTGGKWTTYRAMAEDVLEQCFNAGRLPRRPCGATRTLRLVGAPDRVEDVAAVAAPAGPHLYGTEQAFVEALPGAGRELGGGLTEAMVRFMLRYEYARTVEDVLARRSRLLFVDAAMAGALAEEVAAIMHEEGVADPRTQAFGELARLYRRLPD